MADMELEHLYSTTKRINAQKFASAGHDAAERAGGNFMKQQKMTDPAEWSPETWNEFVWAILSAGVAEMIKRTDAAYQEALRGIDEIPY